MKAKIERGSGFRGVLDYAFGKGDAEIIGGTMSGRDPRALAAEFGLSRAARPDVLKPVWHTSLSLPPGETMTPGQWDKVVSDFMQGMGLGGHQYVAVRHHDTDHEHVHIIASRIGLDGSLYLGKWDAKRAIKLTADLEVKHGLTITKGLEDGPAPVATPTRREVEMSLRTGDAPPRVVLQQIVDAALSEPSSVFDFIDRLEAAGVGVKANVASTGKMNGFSFMFAGVPFKASDLGKSYGWKALQERGVEYVQDRDGQSLIERANRSLAPGGNVNDRGPDALDRNARPTGDRPDPSDAGIQGSGRIFDRDADDLNTSGRADDLGGTSGGPERPVIVSGGSLESREGVSESGGDDGISKQSNGRTEQDAERQSQGDVSSDLSANSIDQEPQNMRGRRRSWDGLGSRVAGLASDAPGLTNAVTPAVRAKMQAWSVQSHALGSPHYRLTLKSRRNDLPSFNIGKGRGVDGAERFYTADDVSGLIPYLSAQNLKGRDIYLTPIDHAHHYLVVDDMTPETLTAMTGKGWRPALVQESSQGNRQAILKVPRVDGPNEQSVANALVVSLNREFGDPNFSGAVHPFRMSGFANKKPGRDNAFTRIIEAAGVICDKARDALAGIRAAFKPAPLPRIDDRPDRGLIIRPPASGGAFSRAREMILGLAVKNGWTVDESRLDFNAARLLTADGMSADEVAAGILEESPRLTERHRDPHGYAMRTAQNAALKQGAQRPTDPSPKP
ncbi:DNA-primase RepB domain-containing protein [Acetobacter orientalis]|uniref:relaxase/mobilization nuclease domain-containing protein n=1 Tax=Acetobacter orientalis TaxID=146474 RepID=UPI00209F180F|nr:relaxase/mobilization nuclease domain-containing protein [Acetobacter orientalis]MCP1217308.1 DNA-primase RepB domain-containing protein [Acetobacter orientalis]MCP1220197.1 DNA-primase RepB domain-containing protein [Acetobacter orientalis]